MITDKEEEERIIFKPDLKFRIGDSVFHKSDVDMKIPMTICSYWLRDSEFDYFCEWFSGRKEVIRQGFIENALLKT